MGEIFEILKKIDCGTAVYDEIEKDFSPYMIMKWMASTKDPQRIQLVNQLLNSSLFALGKDKKLLFNLCMTISDGEERRYKWTKRPKKVPEEIINTVASYYDISHNEALTSLHILSKESIIDMTKDMGYTDKEIKSLKTKLNATELS